MLAKFSIEYVARLKGHSPVNHFANDDPVACEEFLMELLERGFQVKAIRHEGIDLPKPQFDQMIKTAAGMMAAKSICTALGISPEEERYRFGFSG